MNVNPRKLWNAYGKDAPEAPSQTNGKASTECQANGCPLPGTYRISNETSLCCIHEGEDAHLWAEQTERILPRLRLWWLALDMSNAQAGQPIKQSTINDVIAEGGPDDADVKTQRDYAQKIRAFLIKECKGERKAPVQLTPVKALVAKLTGGH